MNHVKIELRRVLDPAEYDKRNHAAQLLVTVPFVEVVGVVFAYQKVPGVSGISLAQVSNGVNRVGNATSVYLNRVDAKSKFSRRCQLNHRQTVGRVGSAIVRFKR